MFPSVSPDVEANGEGGGRLVPAGGESPAAGAGAAGGEIQPAGGGAVGVAEPSVQNVLTALERLVLNLEPGELSGTHAAAQAERFAKAERLCRTAKALLAARAAECREHQRRGHRSAESWLASLSGEGQGRAQSVLGTVQQADAQPLLGAALRSGELSMDQAALVADAGRTAPGSVGRLLDVARRQPMGALREEAERAKAAARSEESERARFERLHRQRSLKIGTTTDGAVFLRGELAPIEGAVVKAALEHEAKHVFTGARRENRRESHEAYLADALVRLCRGDAKAPARPLGLDPSTPSDADHAGRKHAEDAGARHAEDGGAGHAEDGGARHAEDGGARHADDAGARHAEDGGARQRGPRSDAGILPNAAAEPAGAGMDSTGRQLDVPAGAAPSGPAEASSPGEAAGNEPTSCPSRTGSPEYLVVLEVSLEALRRGQLESGERCEIRGVGPVPLATLEDLIGRSRVNLVVRRGADVCSVVHMGRTIPAAIRSALERRDPVCCVPGCGSTYALEIDHRIPWSSGGPTELWNLCRLCKMHHRMKTYSGFRLEGQPGRWSWITASGPCADGRLSSYPDQADPKVSECDQPVVLEPTAREHVDGAAVAAEQAIAEVGAEEAATGPTQLGILDVSLAHRERRQVVVIRLAPDHLPSAPTSTRRGRGRA